MRQSLAAFRTSLLVALGVTAGCQGKADGRAVCTNPKPHLVAGQETGFVQCEEGHMHRVEAKRCPQTAPRAQACGGRTLPTTTCTLDSECTERPNGRCIENTIPPAPAGCGCRYGCEVDADCGPGFVCVCGDPLSVCLPAKCATDADCGGALCATMNVSKQCPMRTLTCLGETDSCAGDAECGANETCTVPMGEKTGPRRCVADTCTPGRPFLVAEEARTAPLGKRVDWHASASELPALPDLRSLTLPERAARAAHWARVGQMEHASIAAFARFSMQLLSLGAPASLVEETTRAMHDETVHAKLAFSLASAYAGEAIGPGPLPIDGAMAPASFDAIVRLTIREGCIGETVAALEAQAALENEADPVVARVLARIVDDETRHALLAFRFVQWAATRDRPTVARVFREELEAHTQGPMATRRGVREAAVAQVVLPCAEALLAPAAVEEPANAETRAAA